MTWLLIVLGVAIVVSPLMWFRQSPRQKLITELRREASSQGIQVTLHRRPDAREDETRLETVCYRIPWPDDSCRQSWVLHRYSGRGWESACSGWLWTISQAPPEWDHKLPELVTSLPSGVSAIVANNTGIGVIWNEREDADDLVKIVENVKKLQSWAKKI